MAISNNKLFCNHCKLNCHTIYNCKKFEALSPSSRFSVTKKLQLCTNCLRRNHTYETCKSTTTCQICKQKTDHTKLHCDAALLMNNTSTNSNSQPSTSSQSTFTIRNEQSHNPNYVFLATARVLVRTSRGEFIPCRALLDSCSQLHFVTNNLVQKLRIRRQNSNLSIRGVGGYQLQLKQS
jgi:hypothetical protein